MGSYTGREGKGNSTQSDTHILLKTWFKYYKISIQCGKCEIIFLAI